MPESFCGSGIFSYLCTVALLAHLWAVGGLMYEKDVFERLSLCTLNFATSQPQQTDDNRDVCVVRFYVLFLKIYSSCWRGLMSVVYPVWRGNAKAQGTRMGERTAPTPFLYRKLIQN